MRPLRFARNTNIPPARQSREVQRLLLYVVALSIASATGPCLAQPRSLNDLVPMTTAYPQDGVVLGQGFDMVLMQKVPTNCVTGANTPLRAGEMSVSFTNVYDTEDIYDSLKISASVSGSFGIGGGSASAEYSKTVKTDHDRRHIMANVSVMRDGEQLAPSADLSKPNEGSIAIRLTPFASNLANQAIGERGARRNSPKPSAVFRTVCGDGYVAAIRTGAKLQMVFSYAMDTTDITEKFGGQASGNYGPVSAKLAIDSLHTGKSGHTEIAYTMFQVGGKIPDKVKSDGTPTVVLPTDPVSAVDYFQQFGAFGANSPVPIEIVVVPYSQVVGVPEGLRDMPLPDAGTRDLAMLYKRLTELSSLYAAGYNKAQAYYHPFVDPQQEAAAARRLQVAADCVAVMESVCAHDGVCTLSALLTNKTVVDQCSILSPKGIALNSLVGADAVDVLSLIVGRPGVISDATEATFKSNPAALTNLQRTQIARANTAVNAAVRSWWDVAEKALGGTTRLMAPTNDSTLRSPYDTYLAYYARAPWPRYYQSGGNPTPQDLPELVYTFCTATVANSHCADFSSANMVQIVGGSSSNYSDGAALYKSFVSKTVLAPLAAAFCDKDITHPMCQLPDVLPGYLDDSYTDLSSVAFGLTRGFVNVAPPPPPPPPAQAPPPPAHCGPDCHGPR